MIFLQVVNGGATLKFDSIIAEPLPNESMLLSARGIIGSEPRLFAESVLRSLEVPELILCRAEYVLSRGESRIDTDR
jgi:hypothetical protein